jgi:hypothetical protein
LKKKGGDNGEEGGEEEGGDKGEEGGEEERRGILVMLKN